MARAVSAQVVTGTVVLPDSVTPVSGVIVIATDAGGTTLARGLTNGKGAFTVRLPAAATIDIKLLRIGYRPSKGPTVTVAAGAVQTVRIVFSAAAVSLVAVNVRERETCRVQADSGLMVASLWEEARKAMLTSQLTSEEAPLFAEWIEYDRTLDSASRMIRFQRVRTTKTATTHAFRSVPANILQTSGYVVDDGGTTSYYAPDAEVLLSDGFVTAHCFHIVAPPANDPHVIGVAFTPTRERSGMHEIDGTLWINRTTAELRDLQFRYTNLPDAATAGKPGGSVEFRRLADGNWLVRRWSLRMPELVSKPASTNLKLYVSGNRLALNAVQVRGGEVIRATRRDTLVYQDTGASIAVQVVAQNALVPVVEARLELDGTDYTSFADETGKIVLSPILAGRYIARVHTALMDSLGMPPLTKEVETRMDARVDSLTLPSPRDLVARVCPADSVRDGEGMLHGWLKDERARAISNAVVTVNWKESFSKMKDGAGATHLGFSAKTLGGRTDGGGYWRVCGVPQEVPLSVGVVSDSGSDIRTVRLVEVPFAQVDLVLHHMVVARTDVDLSYGNGVAHPKGLLELSVVNDKGDALRDVTLEIRPTTGVPVIVLTGPTGRALAPEIAPGVVSVRARHLGYMEGFVSATVKAGRNTVPIIMSAASTPLLDTVRVVGDKIVRGRLGEFEERRLDKSATASFTRADILERNPSEASQMIETLPSVRVWSGFGGERPGDMATYAISPRSGMAFGTANCYMMVAVDGVVKKPSPGQPAFDLRQLPRPDEIHGIEVFAGPASIPLQYGGEGDGSTWCGLIAVWTR
jgi:hypothetical protein